MQTHVGTKNTNIKKIEQSQTDRQTDWRRNSERKHNQPNNNNNNMKKKKKKKRRHWYPYRGSFHLFLAAFVTIGAHERTYHHRT